MTKSLNVSANAHKAAKKAALECDMTISQWVEEAIAIHSGGSVDLTLDPLDLHREPLPDGSNHPSRAFREPLPPNFD